MTAQQAAGHDEVEVAHEALIRQWPRLRTWLETDRADLLLRDSVREAAQEWEQHDRDESYLAHRGRRLEAAEALQHHKRVSLNAQEQAYLNAAIAFRERERQIAEQARLARERLRQRVVLGLTIFSVVALLLAVFAGWQWQDARRQSIAARSAEATAVAEGRLALSRQIASQSRAHVNDLDLGLLLSAEAYRLNPQDFEVRRNLLAAVQEQPQLDKFLHGHQGAIRDLAFSPNGSVLASASQDGTIFLWDPIIGMKVGAGIATGHRDLWRIAFHPDGQRLASVGLDSTIRLWNLHTGSNDGPVLTSEQGQVEEVAFNPDGTVLASATRDGTIELWNVATRTRLGEALKGHEGDVLSLDFSADGSMLVSAGYVDGTVRFWDVAAVRQTGVPLSTYQGGVAQALLSSDGSTLATAGVNGTIRLWDVGTRLEIADALTLHQAVVTIAFDEDSTTLASADGDGKIQKWNIVTRQPIGEPIVSGQGSIFAVALSPDGLNLVSGGSDGTIRLWNTEANRSRLFESVSGHVGIPQAIAFSPDGSTIATGGDDGVIQWDANDGSQLGVPLQGHSESIVALGFSPDGSLLASGSEDDTVRLWDLKAGVAIRSPLGSSGGDVTAVTFSPSGDVIASSDIFGYVRLWRVSEGTAVVNPLNAEVGAVYSLAINPEGTILATAGSNGTIRLWDIASQQPIGSPMEHENGPVRAVRFVRNGKWLASAGDDGTIYYWDATDGSSIRSFVAHEAGVLKLVSNHDGSRLASSGWDGAVRIWKVGRANLIAEPVAADDSGSRLLAFSPDGSRLAFTNVDQASGGGVTVALWDVDEEVSSREFPTNEIIRDATMSADGSKIVSGGRDGRLVIWDVETNVSVAEQQINDEGGISKVAASRDGSLVALGTPSGSIRIWDVASGISVSPPQSGHESDITALTFSNGGELLASGAADGTVQLWNVRTQQPVGEPFAYENPNTGQPWTVGALAFSPDRSLLAVSGWATVVLWNVEEHRLDGPPLRGLDGRIPSVAFSPDGRLIAAGGYQVVRVWDVGSRQPVGKPLVVAEDEVQAIAYNADGSQLATGATGDVKIWDLSSGSALGNFDGTGQAMISVNFTAGGEWLIAADNTGMIARWAVAGETWLQQACKMANRNLTSEEWQRYIGNPHSLINPYHKTCPELPESDGTVLATPIGENTGPLALATPSVPDGTSAVHTKTDDPVLTGDPVATPPAYAQAVQLAVVTDNPDLNNDICRAGSLDGFAEIVSPSCDRAVELAPGNGSFADSRGLARALAGDYPGAAQDFERFVVWAREVGLVETQIHKREAWIAELQAGRNPFDSEMIKELRTEVIEYAPPPKGTPTAATAAAAQSTLVPVDEGSVLPPTTMPIDVLNPSPVEPAATPALTGADSSLAKWPLVPTPTMPVAIWSQEP